MDNDYSKRSSMTTLIAAMCIFSLTMSITPGPVNMVIVASGAGYGFRRTLPFVSGATIGFILLLLMLGFGLMQVVSAHPVFLKYLSIAGAMFIIYVSYLIISSNPAPAVENSKCPGFKQSFLMQWLNPKAWLACIAGLSMFADGSSHGPLLIFATIYFVLCYLSLAAWGVLGSRLKHLLDSPGKMRLFNVTMGGLLCICAVYILFESLRS